MEVEDAFEKWLSDWVSRNPGGELSPKTVWFVASRWGYGQTADKIAALEAERDALQAKVKQNDTAYINGWNDAHRAIAAKEPV